MEGWLLRVGIPRALLYYYYFPLWNVFFEELGAEVVVSEQTNKQLVDEGIKISVPEICVPIKIYNGHILDLVKKSVDFFFIPRMESIKRGEFFCPKFMGLPDMIRYSIPGVKDKILEPGIKCATEKITDFRNYMNMADPLGVTETQIRKALKKAERVWLHFRSLCKAGFMIPDAMDVALGQKSKAEIELPRWPGDVNIGVMGYVYDVYDGFVGMDILNRLTKIGVSFRTFEMLNERVLGKQLKGLRKILFWTFSNKLLEAGYYFYREKVFDGIIHVTAFGCGPDSLLGKVMELESERYGKPFMTIRVDEHTGESHLQTRVEAFVDLIRRKKISHGGAGI